MNNPYSALARFYDRLMVDYNYERIYDYIVANVEGNKGIDLACGSGRLTIELAFNGYNMIGIDKSTDMLNMAVCSARKKGVKVPFVEGDINNLELALGYDFAIATCDVLNYISPDRLENFLITINKSLKKDAILMLDYSSSYKLRDIIGDNLFYEDYEDMTYIWENNIKNNSIIMDLTFFVKEGNNYTRLDEQHTQFIYDLNYIKDKLEITGFDILDILDGDSFDSINDESKRIIIKAGKR